MNELTDFINNNPNAMPSEFREASKKWAAHAIETYKDDLLGKALLVSKAIADFLNEMEGQK